jgi:hypothetical protein
MLNRDVFQTDPEQYRIANQGVAKIIFPPEGGIVTETLHGELQTFVTDGEYGRGLVRLEHDPKSLNQKDIPTHSVL